MMTMMVMIDDDDGDDDDGDDDDEDDCDSFAQPLSPSPLFRHLCHVCWH